MNVILRPLKGPDVYIASSGEYLDLEKLDQLIHVLIAARRWLKAEIARQQSNK